MSHADRWSPALKSLFVCTGAAAAVLGLAAVGGSAARATPPVGALAATYPAQAGFGTIKGRLVWGGDQAPAPKVLQPVGQAAKDPEVCAKDAAIPDEKMVVDPENKGIRYAFAYLVRPSGENPEATRELTSKTPAVEVDQKNCRFIPRSVALHQDQSLVLKSSDPVNHNVHLTAFTNAGFNELLPANGTASKKLVAEKRAVPLVCDIHPWMKANIMIFNHPFFAVTAADGSFEIKGVPAGAQKLVVWQEASGYVTPGAGSGMPVTVEAGKTVDLGEIKLDPAKAKL